MRWTDSTASLTELDDQEQQQRRQLQNAHYRQLQAGCKLLTGSDRALMEMYLTGDADYTAIAALLGKSRSTVTRRISRLTAAIVGHSGHPVKTRRALAADEMTLVRLYRMQGLAVCEIVLRTGLSHYRVRRLCRQLGIKPVASARDTAGDAR